MQSVLAAALLTLRIAHTYPGHVEWQSVIEITSDDAAKSALLAFTTVENEHRSTSSRRVSEKELRELEAAWGASTFTDLGAWPGDPLCASTGEKWVLSVGDQERRICQDKGAMGRLSKLTALVMRILKEASP